MTRSRIVRYAGILAVLALASSLTPRNSLAQYEAEPIVIGETVTIRSSSLNEDRTVLVYTPQGYDGSTAIYPVLYLLDGDAHFHHTTGIIDFLSRTGNMSQMIVVALPNTDRTRDLTPVTTTDTANIFPTAGGADSFLAFIADELEPYIDERYRTAPYSVLVGHSFGGLFAVYALLTRPEVFNVFVSISPSLWWNDGSLVEEVQSFFATHPESDRFLYYTMGNEGGAMLSSAWAFAAALQDHAPETFEWEFVLMEEETHGSIPHRTTYKALELLYDTWSIPSFVAFADEEGLAAFDAHYAALSKKYGYEITTPEATVNQLGYYYIGQERTEEAIAVLKRNVEVYPGSANVYDSLGDAYDAAGQYGLARNNYEKAVELAEATNSQFLDVYRANLERIREKIGTN